MLELHPLDVRLIQLLAATDALHEPVRHWQRGSHEAAAVAERLHAYRRSGLPYQNPAGGSNAERQEAFRQADQLERSGKVVFSKRAGKRVGWRLSDAEDWDLRWNALLYGERELRDAMQLILAHVAAGNVHGNGSFVPEDLLSGCTWGDSDQSDKLVDLEERLAPGLCRGLVTWASDNAGRCGYSVTPMGKAWLDNWQEPPERPYDPDLSEAAATCYSDCLRAERDARSGWRPSVPNCVSIPLSAGLWPVIRPLDHGGSVA